MTYHYLGLLTLLLLQTWSNASVIPFNGEVNVEEVGVEDLKDLLLTSMQNTVSLNNLVTQLTQKIVNIMLTLGDTTTRMEQMRETLSTEIEELKNKIETLNATTDTDIENIKEALVGVEKNVSTGMEQMGQTLSTEFEELKNEIKIEQNTTDTNIAKVKEGLAKVKNNVTTLGSGIQELREELHEVQMAREVSIVGGQEAGDSQCVKVCSGTSGRRSTNWVDFTGAGDNVSIYTDVDISECNFVKIPKIMTSLDGSSYHRLTTGGTSIYQATTTSFRVYVRGIDGNNPRDGNAARWEWNIDWVAVGYTC